MVTAGPHRSKIGFTFLHAGCNNGMSFLMFMAPALFVELLAGFLAGCLALWFVTQRFAWTQHRLSQSMQRLKPLLEAYLLNPGLWASAGLLALRLSIGVMMIHHGQEKLSDPQQFASTYVASLHLPFPLVFAYVAGLSELIGSWLVISDRRLQRLCIGAGNALLGRQHRLAVDRPGPFVNGCCHHGNAVDQSCPVRVC